MEDKYYLNRMVELLGKYKQLMYLIKEIDEKDSSYNSKKKKIREIADEIYFFMDEVRTIYRSLK